MQKRLIVQLEHRFNGHDDENRIESSGPQSGTEYCDRQRYRECMRQCDEQIILEHCSAVRSITFRLLGLIFQGQFDRTTNTHTRSSFSRSLTYDLHLSCFASFNAHSILCKVEIPNRLPYHSAHTNIIQTHKRVVLFCTQRTLIDALLNSTQTIYIRLYAF